jgi:hypothetical protein
MFAVYRNIMSSGAPIEIGTTIKYPSAALLCVDSNDQQSFDRNGFRIDNTIPGRIYINNQRPLMFGYMTRLALTEMNIVWDTPNVSSTNNTLTFAIYTATDAATPVVTLQDYIRIEVTPNFYTQDELAAELITLLNADPVVTANGLTFGVVYDEQEKNFTIRQIATYVAAPNRIKGYFKLISCTAPSTLTGLSSLTDDLTFCMGFQCVNSTVGTGYYSRLVGAYAPMVQTPYVDVVSNLLTKNQNVSDGTTSKIYTTSKLARIYFTNEAITNEHPDFEIGTDLAGVNNTIGVRPFRFRREFKIPKQIQWNATENVDAIDIQVLDYKGNPISIEEQITTSSASTTNEISLFERNNTSFQFTIQVTEV